MACLFKRSNGIYYVALVNINGKRSWHSTHCLDRSEAEMIAKEISGQLEKPRVITLKVFQRMIKEYAETNFSKGTASIYNRSFQRLIQSVGDIILKCITPLLMEKFKQDCLKEVKPVTANMYLRTIRAAFNVAKEWRLIDANPAKSCKLLRVGDEEPVYLKKEDINTLVKHIKDIQFKRIVLLAIFTGMRRGEIVNLKWEDMDFSNRFIRVRNRDTFKVKGGHPRTIPMHPYIHGLFLTLHQSDGYVFIDSSGKAITPYYITRTFKRCIRKSGLPEKYHFHSLRHTCATWLVNANTPLYDVQKILGHQSITTTQIYAHLPNEHLRRSIENIDFPTQLVGMN